MTQEVRRMIFGACIVALAGVWYFSLKEKPAGGTGVPPSATSAPNTSDSGASTK